MSDTTNLILQHNVLTAAVWAALEALYTALTDENASKTIPCAMVPSLYAKIELARNLVIAENGAARLTAAGLTVTDWAAPSGNGLSAASLAALETLHTTLCSLRALQNTVGYQAYADRSVSELEIQRAIQNGAAVSMEKIGSVWGNVKSALDMIVAASGGVVTPRGWDSEFFNAGLNVHAQ
jgi:hypothetical protein